MLRVSVCFIMLITIYMISLSVNAAPSYSITVYSAAAPGDLDTERLAQYGDHLPGYALVRDGRKIDLKSGTNEIRFSDVAKRIDPTTVSFASVTDSTGTRVVEQNYQYDLVSATKLLQRYVGQNVTVEQSRGERMEHISGQLLSASNGLILAQTDGQIITLNDYSNVLFPSLPGGLITKPTLVWLIDASRAGTHDAVVSYQTQGMIWWTDYNITLRNQQNACDMDLAAWVTLVNQSGASFPNAQLKLVAGEVNRAPVGNTRYRAQDMEYKSMAAPNANAGFQESSLFEYHLYTLGRRTDLSENATKQLELFPAAMQVACKKQLIFTASPTPLSYWGRAVVDQNYGATTEATVGAYLEFENKESNKMGMPMPAGRVRVNQAGLDGNLEFIGEDIIKHTPRNETVKIKLGNSFDVVGERKQTHFAYNDSADTITESFEITVRNQKKQAEHVVVREYLYRWSKWNIQNKNQDYVKRDASTIDFPVDIPAGGEQKITYTVQYSW